MRSDNGHDFRLIDIDQNDRREGTNHPVCDKSVHPEGCRQGVFSGVRIRDGINAAKSSAMTHRISVT